MGRFIMGLMVISLFVSSLVFIHAMVKMWLNRPERAIAKRRSK